MTSDSKLKQIFYFYPPIYPYYHMKYLYLYKEFYLLLHIDYYDIHNHLYFNNNIH